MPNSLATRPKSTATRSFARQRTSTDCTTVPKIGDRLPAAGAIDWEALEPRGFYARYGRTLTNGLLFFAALAPVLLVGACVALVNIVAFRSVRKIFYTQPRVGRRGRIFRIYKFRTMSEPTVSAAQSWFASADRARVTHLGRFLRNTHCDELPQLLNILKGEMTFIGPRPEMVEVEVWAAEHVPGFTRRLVLTPGITGHAQITQGYTGCAVEAYARKLALNELYRERVSLRMDVSILARTLVWIARGRGWKFEPAANGPRAERPAKSEPGDTHRSGDAQRATTP